MAAEERYVVRENSGIGPPYQVYRPDVSVIAEVTDYLHELIATNCSQATIRAYAYALLDWFRFLSTGGTAWQDARSDHVRDYVLHLRSSDNPYRHRRRAAAFASAIRPVAPERGHQGIALDGQAQRGRLQYEEDGSPVHALVAFCQDYSVVLVSEPIDNGQQKDEAELTVVPAVVERIDWRGRVLTGDALSCQRALC